MNIFRKLDEIFSLLLSNTQTNLLHYVTFEIAKLLKVLCDTLA